MKEFIVKLRLLIKEANYPKAHYQRFLQDFLVFGMNSQSTRKECLKEGNTLTFQKAKDPVKAEESADTQLILMNKATEVNTVKKHSTRKASKSGDKHSSAETVQKTRFGCGHGPHAHDKCPAKSAKCHFCKKIGHFANFCLSKKQKQSVHEVEVKHAVNTSELSLPESAVFMGPIEATPLNVNTVTCKDKAVLSVKIAPSSKGCQKTVTCEIDSGAETNIVPRSLYNQICPETTKLEKPTVKLSAYGGTEIPNLGVCKMYFQGSHNRKPKQIIFEVIDVPGPVIIGNTTARELNLLKLNWPVPATPKSSSGEKHPSPLTKEYLLKEYKDVFTGIGLFPGKSYQIEVDESIPPVQYPPRQVTVHPVPAYKRELERLTDLGIITDVQNEFTPWVNSVVATPEKQTDHYAYASIHGISIKL